MMNPPSNSMSDIPPGCARIVDSNGEGETFWPVSKPLLRESLKEQFPQAKNYSLRVGSDPIRSQHIPRQGASLAMGETYTVKVPEKVKPVAEPRPSADESTPTPDVAATTPNEELKCGICFETITEQGVMNSCKHDFCFLCIHKWSKVTNKCPMCKAEFTTIERKMNTPPTEEPSTRRGRPRRKGASVVNVKPKQQKYEYTRQELEQIAGIHDEDDRLPHHNAMPFFFPMGMSTPMGLHQLFLQTAFPHLPPGFLASMGAAPVIPQPSRSSRRFHDEDEDEDDDVDDSWFEDDSDDDSVPEQEMETQPTRGTASRSTVFTPTPSGSRARLRQLISMPPEMRNLHRQNNRSFHRGPAPSPFGQPNFQSNLNTLKAMFMPTFDEELIQTVLLQTGNSVDRAVEALLEMQPPAQTDQQAVDVQHIVAEDSHAPEVELDKEVIVLDHDELFPSNMYSSSRTAPKRKFDWDSKESIPTSSSSSSSTSSMGNDNINLSQEKSTADEHEGIRQGPNGLKKRRRMRLSFGEMWEEDKDGGGGSGVEEKGGDQELVELAWQDYAALQKNEKKERRHAETTLLRGRPGRGHGVADLASSTEELLGSESNPCEGDMSTGAGEGQRVGGGEGLQKPTGWGTRRGASVGRFGLPPHLSNSGGSLSRRK